jgi:hypothetical protein
LTPSISLETCYTSPPVCQSVFPSSCIVIVFTQMLVVITTRKPLLVKPALGILSHGGLKENRTVGKMVEDSGAIIPVNHGIYFWDLSRLQ